MARKAPARSARPQAEGSGHTREAEARATRRRNVAAGPKPLPVRGGLVKGVRLEEAIGQQLRAFRQQLNLTVSEVARQAGLSAALVSKIERGITSPSLSTLTILSWVLNVPITALFRKYDVQRNASFVPAGGGLRVERRGTRYGHEYQLLGHVVRGPLQVEPYLISVTDPGEVFPVFQHPGLEFIFMLEGEMVYRHGGDTWRLKPGDALLFDSDVAHGPEELVVLPVRFLSNMCSVTGSG